MENLFGNVSFAGQVMRFNPFLMMINIIALAGFIFSYVKMYKKTGKVVDYWHFISLQFFIIPVLLMYPFSASSGNIMATGNAYYLLEPYVNLAYLIGLVGYFSFLIGGGAAGSGRFKLNIMEQYYKPLSSTSVLIVFSSFLLVMFLVFMVFQIATGQFSDPRSFFMEHSKYRPIYNFLISYFKVIVVLLGALYIDKRNKAVALLLVVVCLLGISLGTRSSLIDPVCYVAFLFFMSNREKIKVWHAVLFTLVVMIVVFMLGALRSGHADKIFFNIIYGNTFSDTRDFAWILSHWDFNYVYGKTYVSGLISFIPSSMSDYREFWAVSRYTNRFVGFDSLVHPGLRPGKFGEPFFNFGIIGVALLGSVLGFFLRKVSNEIDDITSNSTNGKALKAFLATLPFQLVSMFCLTSGFFEFYVLIIVIMCMVLFYNTVNRFGWLKKI